MGNKQQQQQPNSVNSCSRIVLVSPNMKEFVKNG